MSTAAKKDISPLMLIVAFATLYLVWGSTYFFIGIAVQSIPPFIMGAMRFVAAGLLLMIWCLVTKDPLFNWKQIKFASVTGVCLLFVGTGAVIFAEKTLASSLVAVIISSQAIWLVLMDRKHWKETFTNRNTVMGLVIGFIGVILLFSESATQALGTAGGHASIIALVVLFIGMLSWSGGSIYSKYKSFGSSTVNSTWQMISAGIVFLLFSFIFNEWKGFDIGKVPANAWLSVLYLVIFGSLAGFSAYVWLLKVRPVSQVGTHVYVNPVVAVLLGVFFAGEKMSFLQTLGLGIILTSVLLINFNKYRIGKKALAEQKPPKEEVNPRFSVKPAAFTETEV